MVTLSMLVVALRRAGNSRDTLRVAARSFAQLPWGAMAEALTTGFLQVWLRGIPWAYAPLQWKFTAVATAVVLSAIHHATARNSGAAARSMIQLLILVASIAIFVAAANLRLS